MATNSWVKSLKPGAGVAKLKTGDRVVVPFTISCRFFLPLRTSGILPVRQFEPERRNGREVLGHSPSRDLRLLSFARRLSRAGRRNTSACPYADVGPLKIPRIFPMRQVLFLSDIFPTGYQAAENCAIKPVDTVAVWGCGPVGQFAIQSARLMGAKRIIAIDHFEERLLMAKKKGTPKSSITKRPKC